MPLDYYSLVSSGPDQEGFLGGLKRGILPWQGYPREQPFFSGGTLGYALGEQALYSGAMRAITPWLLARLGATTLAPEVAIPLQMLMLAGLGVKSAIGQPDEEKLKYGLTAAAFPMLPVVWRKIRGGGFLRGGPKAASAAPAPAASVPATAQAPAAAPAPVTATPVPAPPVVPPVPPAPVEVAPVPVAPAPAPAAPVPITPAPVIPAPATRAPVTPAPALREQLMRERTRINELIAMRERLAAMADRPGKERDVSRATAWINREIERRWANVRKLNAAYEAGLKSVPELGAIKLTEVSEGADLSNILRSGGVTLDELQVTGLKSVQSIKNRLAETFIAENKVTPETAAAMADRVLARLAEGKDRKQFISALSRAARGLRTAEDGPDVRQVLLRAFGEISPPSGVTINAAKTGGRQYAQAALEAQGLAALKTAELAFSGITMGDLANALKTNALDMRSVAKMLARFSDVRGAVLGRVGQNVNGEIVPPLAQFIRAMLKDVAEGRLGDWASLDVQNIRPLLAEYIKTKAPSKLVMGLSRENVEANLAQALGVPLETLQKTTSKLSNETITGALSVYETSLQAGAPPAFARDLAAQSLGVRNLSRLLFPSAEDAAQELAWAKAAASGRPGPVLARAIANQMGVDWLDVYAFAEDASMGLFDADDVLLVMANRLNLPTESILDKTARASLAAFYERLGKITPPDPYVKSVVRNAVRSRLTPGVIDMEDLQKLGVDDVIQREPTARSLASKVFSRESGELAEAGEETFVRPLIEDIEPRGVIKPFEQTEVYPEYVEAVKKLEALGEPKLAAAGQGVAARGKAPAVSLIQEMDETFFGEWVDPRTGIAAPHRDPRTARRLRPVIRAINKVLDDRNLTDDEKRSAVARIVRGFKRYIFAKGVAEKPIPAEGIPGRRVEVEPSKVRRRRIRPVVGEAAMTGRKLKRITL